jgi:AcrR family transcriptional regulator
LTTANPDRLALAASLLSYHLGMPDHAEPMQQTRSALAPSTPRDKLIQAALHFFAERGTTVPMVEISAAAGNRNKSAIAYHFDGRVGLIEAIFTEINGFLKPRYHALLLELEAKSATDLSLYEVVLALNAPFFALYASQPNGEASLKTLTRLGLDSIAEEQGMYRRFMTEIFSRFANLIIKIRPQKTLGEAKLHLAHFMQATVNGLALTDGWDDADFRSNPELMFELLLSYADYVSGGMGCSALERPQIDLNRWRKEIEP